MLQRIVWTLVALSSATCFTWIPAHNYVDVRRGVRLCRFAAENDLQSLAEKLKQGMNSFKEFAEPEPETKRAKVNHYCDITGTKDKVAAEAALKKFEASYKHVMYIT